MTHNIRIYNPEGVTNLPVGMEGEFRNVVVSDVGNLNIPLPSFSKRWLSVSPDDASHVITDVSEDGRTATLRLLDTPAGHVLKALTERDVDMSIRPRIRIDGTQIEVITYDIVSPELPNVD